MNLSFFNRFKKKVLPLYYLVLVLRDEKAEAVIFEELEGVAKIVGQKEEHFSTSIDEISSDELLEKLDKAISSAESSLPENIQTQKTIFGIKESWADNDQIKKEHLAKLKKVKEELGLIPIGFLVISQAISHLLQKEEGVPVSAILVEINKKNITVTLLRAGKNIETKSSAIHESIPFTVDTLLKHFDVPEILPSRIIIFDGKEDFSQEFISHTWSKSLPFLHLPQITNLPVGFDAKSVLFGAATQMGFKITNTENLEKPEEDTEEIKEITSVADVKPSEIEEESPIENPIGNPMPYKNLEAADFGFTKDIDVAKIEFQEQVKEEQPARHATPRVAGGEVIAQIDTQEEYVTSKSPSGINSKLTSIRNASITIFGLILSNIKRINLKKIPSLVTSGKLSLVGPGILILIITLIGSYFLFIKATITITVDPEITQQDRSVLFSTTKATDPGNNIIKGEFVTVSEDGSVSTQATGKKDVGTSATGTITIFNTLSQDKTITEGTVITSTNGLKFTLDQSVTVKAVASHSADEPPPPSQTVTANVTASQLGKESNLPSGTRFTVSSFDLGDIAAKNDNPFSGGTKKEVTVVSKNDSIKLEEDLLKQLENNAKEDLQKQIGQNKILLPAFITSTISSKSLNVKIGDETNQATLTGTVEYQGITYDKNDLISFSKSLLEKDVPLNQEVDYNNIQATVKDIKSKNDEEVQANLNIKTLLLPKIDQKKLMKDVVGKSFKIAQDLIYQLPQVANVSIKLSPNLSLLPKNLPAREGNIKILITK